MHQDLPDDLANEEVWLKASEDHKDTLRELNSWEKSLERRRHLIQLRDDIFQKQRRVYEFEWELNMQEKEHTLMLRHSFNERKQRERYIEEEMQATEQKIKQMDLISDLDGPPQATKVQKWLHSLELVDGKHLGARLDETARLKAQAIRGQHRKHVQVQQAKKLTHQTQETHQGMMSTGKAGRRGVEHLKKGILLTDRSGTGPLPQQAKPDLRTEREKMRYTLQGDGSSIFGNAEKWEQTPEGKQLDSLCVPHLPNVASCRVHSALVEAAKQKNKSGKFAKTNVKMVI